MIRYDHGWILVALHCREDGEKDAEDAHSIAFAEERLLSESTRDTRHVGVAP